MDGKEDDHEEEGADEAGDDEDVLEPEEVRGRRGDGGVALSRAGRQHS